jgi:3-hydroxyacyl-CoA dehydrogenase
LKAKRRSWSRSQDFQKVLHINAYGTFVVDACIADAINSQYPDEGPFFERVAEERGCIVNIASAVANPVPARCLTYGPSKSTSGLQNDIFRGLS